MKTLMMAILVGILFAALVYGEEPKVFTDSDLENINPLDVSLFIFIEYITYYIRSKSTLYKKACQN